jgi:hypothetical protein
MSFDHLCSIQSSNTDADAGSERTMALFILPIDKDTILHPRNTLPAILDSFSVISLHFH